MAQGRILKIVDAAISLYKANPNLNHKCTNPKLMGKRMHDNQLDLGLGDLSYHEKRILSAVYRALKNDPVLTT